MLKNFITFVYLLLLLNTCSLTQQLSVDLLHGDLLTSLVRELYVMLSSTCKNNDFTPVNKRLNRNNFLLSSFEMALIERERT